MAAPIKPALSRAFGTEVWAWVPAIADPAAPTTTELTAAGALRLDGFVFGDQAGITGSTSKVSLPRRIGETIVFEVNGETSYTAADLQIAFDPQAASADDGKKAWETLTDEAVGFLVQRQGIDPNTDFAAAQFVNVYPAQLGVRTTGKTATDATGVYSFTVGVSVTDTPQQNVAIAA